MSLTYPDPTQGQNYDFPLDSDLHHLHKLQAQGGTSCLQVTLPQAILKREEDTF